ncbi:RNA polymerase subunit ABC14.5 [Myxozyma melibiosi]|uniref:DNA-directed RNA polymerases I, II, and III subunit RPABC3 n=1 Tax=Myxozyma melibiosi TaxID=54550 RepID=A0ABR1FD37_9ASCO
MSALLFDDLFTITSLDDKRYDRVSRVTATSNSSADIHLTLDLNTELFPVSGGEILSIALAKTLSLDGDSAQVTSASGWRESKPGERGLADDYDYVMYGTVYKFEEGKNENIAVYVSFGGLLLCLEGSYKKLASLKQENIYILIRR